MQYPDFSYESAKHKQGLQLIAGVDEVGRGPWAGPVVSAAVILDPNNLPEGVTDSKKLSPKKREALYDFIMQTADVSIAEATVEEIDEINIREATFLAMTRALEGLKNKPQFAFIDGNAMPKDMFCPAETVVKGDLHVMSIAAASVVAKVYRDRMMAQLGEEFPHYGWERNAGYGVKAHQEGIASHGITPHHRRSFKPIRAYIEG